MRRVLRSDSTYVDVGGNVGDILAMAVRAAPAGRHFAVEALPHLAEVLEARFPSVTVLNHAVGKETGRTRFHHVLGREAYSGLKRRTYDFPDPVVELIDVDVRRLDGLIPADVVVKLMKFDIEGGELDALAGAVELLRRSRPPVVFEAGWPSSGAYGIGPADFSRSSAGSATRSPRWNAGSARGLSTTRQPSRRPGEPNTTSSRSRRPSRRKGGTSTRPNPDPSRTRSSWSRTPAAAAAAIIAGPVRGPRIQRSSPKLRYSSYGPSALLASLFPRTLSTIHLQAATVTGDHS